MWIGFKMGRDDDMTDGELVKIWPPGDDRMDRLISAELDVSSALGYRFSFPKVSEFAYVLLGMVEPEHATVFMEVSKLLQWCSLHTRFIPVPPVALAAAVVAVVARKLDRVVALVPDCRVEAIYANINFELL